MEERLRQRRRRAALQATGEMNLETAKRRVSRAGALSHPDEITAQILKEMDKSVRLSRAGLERNLSKIIEETNVVFGQRGP